MGKTVKRLATALILSTSLGCKADDLQDPDTVYGFDNVSPRLGRTTSLIKAPRNLTGWLDRAIGEPHVGTMFR